MIIRNLSRNLKYVINIIKYTNCKEIYIGSTQALTNSVSLHKDNIKLPEKIKIFVSKYILWMQQRRL